MVKTPFKIPDVPIPATARPTINIFEEVDMAQRREPSSKMKKKPIKVHYTRNLVRPFETVSNIEFD